MEEKLRSSIGVVPLQITKPCTDKAPSINASTMTPELQQPGEVAPSLAHSQSEAQDERFTGASRSEFHNYLRAFFPFRPPSTISPSSVTLSLEAGNVILVHSIHTNGWADGTLLDTGARGWLPTNYCEGYDHFSMRPLLKALTEFYEMIRNRDDDSLDIFYNPDSMRGLIAGVRFLLEKSECLTRDSILVRDFDSIRRTRKALLSDLSFLVKMVKETNEDHVSQTPSQLVDETFNQMLPSAFKVATRGVKFLDIWLEIWNKADGYGHRKENVTSVLTGSRTSAQHSLRLRSLTSSQLRAHNAQQTTEARATSVGSGTPARSDSWQTDQPSSASTQHRPNSPLSKRTSVTHRMTSAGYSTAGDNSELASERLKLSHDAFLGCLGTFLGLHMQSRSSSELLLTTQQSVTSCRELLTVVAVIAEHDFSRPRLLVETRDAMYDNITALVHAARDIFHPAYGANEDAIFMPDNGDRLINAARDCVRGAGECVATARAVLERIGDFEPDLAELQSSTVGAGPAAGSSSSTSSPTTSHINPTAESAEGNPTPTGPTTPNPPSAQDLNFKVPANLASALSDSVKAENPKSSSASRAGSGTAEDMSQQTSGGPDTSSITELVGTSRSKTLATRDSRSDGASYGAIARQTPAHGNIHSSGSNSTYRSSARDSEMSNFSLASTRATSPEALSHRLGIDKSNDKLPGHTSPTLDEVDEGETKVLEKTFAHELMYSKNGQVIGGTLPALIEKLTAHHSTPDALFVSTFYLTFRLFASSKEFAHALADRFEYIGGTPSVAGPVRLRVYNAFKGWLESHWRRECDDIALPFIRDFAQGTLADALPTAGKRLTELTVKVTNASATLVPRLVSSIGKTNTSTAQYVCPDTPLPSPIMSKHQLGLLRAWKSGKSDINVLDFDPLEIARQITIKESAIFCSILPEELLATEWMKRSGSLAVNVRAMSTLSTDLANLVADSILEPEEPKKRALLIKHWVKIGNKCIELKNYDSLMAIICSLNSSTISRLKKTWEAVSQKTRAVLNELTKVVDVSRNHAALRQRLQTHVPPCLPFVGIYLTDLTFVDHGNPTMRQLNVEGSEIGLINYDKHMKTAKIISELQRFQIPYRLTEVPELQTWMQDQLVRVRSGGEKSFQAYYRRSLILEPRDQAQIGASSSGVNTSARFGEKTFDFLAWAGAHRDKSIATGGSG